MGASFHHLNSLGTERSVSLARSLAKKGPRTAKGKKTDDEKLPARREPATRAIALPHLLRAERLLMHTVKEKKHTHTHPTHPQLSIAGVLLFPFLEKSSLDRMRSGTIHRIRIRRSISSALTRKTPFSSRYSKK